MKKFIILIMLFIALLFFMQADSIVSSNDVNVAEVSELDSLDINIELRHENLINHKCLNCNQLAVVGNDDYDIVMGNERIINYAGMTSIKSRSRLSFHTRFS